MSERFRYCDGPPTDLPADALVARIGEEVRGTEGLYDALSAQLRLPEWFGRNWDALHDSLMDLSWLEGRPVALVHDGLPELSPHALGVYLSVLADAVEAWEEEPGAFIVVLPRSERARVTHLLPPPQT